MPQGHPLLGLEQVTLEDLGTWPLITYDVGFTGRGHIDEAFRQAGIEPDIVLTAMDSDVIQQYVSLGMGVGPAVALLMTLPSISLPSLLMLRKSFTPRVLTTVTLLTMLIGVVSGLVAVVLL